MSANYYMTAVMPYTSGLPRDISTNRYSFGWEGAGDGDPEILAQLAARVGTIYTQIHASTGRSLGSFYSGLVTRAADGCRTEVHRIGGTPGAGPLEVAHWTMPAVGGNQPSLPLEVACVGSFLGNSASLPARSRRGRVFFGPLNNGAMTQTQTSSYPADTLRQTIAAAFAQLLVDMGAEDVDGWNWQVWSQKHGQGTWITNGWVDNEWDTQRRRQIKATERLLWP